MSIQRTPENQIRKRLTSPPGNGIPKRMNQQKMIFPKLPQFQFENNEEYDSQSSFLCNCPERQTYSNSQLNNLLAPLTEDFNQSFNNNEMMQNSQAINMRPNLSENNKNYTENNVFDQFKCDENIYETNESNESYSEQQLNNILLREPKRNNFKGDMEKKKTKKVNKKKRRFHPYDNHPNIKIDEKEEIDEYHEKMFEQTGNLIEFYFKFPETDSDGKDTFGTKYMNIKTEEPEKYSSTKFETEKYSVLISIKKK